MSTQRSFMVEGREIAYEVEPPEYLSHMQYRVSGALPASLQLTQLPTGRWIASVIFGENQHAINILSVGGAGTSIEQALEAACLTYENILAQGLLKGLMDEIRPAA